MTSAAGGILLVGCGKMGGALLSGWIDAGRAPASICIVEPEAATFAKAVSSLPAGIGHVKSPHELSGAYRADIVVVAVKPQIMDEVAPNLRRFAQDGVAVLSIAAGRTIDYFQDALGKRAAIVRAMPNTAASIGRGITAAIANAYVSADQHALCDELLAAVGEVVWLTDEGQMDAVTAVSGSGPAYVFLLAECLAKAGEEAGLPAKLGHPGRVRVMSASTRTSAEAAAALGCTIAEIAKSIIFRAKPSQRAVLVMVSGVNRVDEKKVAALTGEGIGKADAEFVRARTGFVIGGVPPVGHDTPPIVLIDQGLLALATIWAAAGTPHAVFPLTPAELVALTAGKVADVRQG